MKFELEEHHRNIPDKELLADIKQVAIKLNQGSVTTRQYNEHGRFAFSTIALRFGSWRVALEKVWCESIYKDFWYVAKGIGKIY